MLPHQIIDRWFNSKVWQEIVEDADVGDSDSIELMEQVSDQLASLTFHLANNSGAERVAYELAWFNRLCDDFGVA